MIGRGFRRTKATEEVETKGFDAFELRLGDLMRGERATMGKSLLDVQRELKIKAAYIAAIENADPTAFDTPGFIAGYVRSYARYLNMEPDWAFETFCQESGFATAHGMSAAASSVKPTREERIAANGIGKDIFASPVTPFIPAGERFFSGIEPRAFGSVMVLLVLIGGLGYGGWTLLREVQKVQFAPVEQAPTVVADLDPLAGASRAVSNPALGAGAFVPPSAEALDRLYRPEALDLPVLVARDGPISTLDPASRGLLAAGGARAAQADMQVADANRMQGPLLPDSSFVVATAGPVAGVDELLEELIGGGQGPAVQVTTGPAPEVKLVAVRPAWVRVQSAGGSVIFEGILDAGDTFDVPATEDPARLRVGESGALYFAVNGTHYGPVGSRGQVTSNVALSASDLMQTYTVADLSRDSDLAEYVNVAQMQASQ